MGRGWPGRRCDPSLPRPGRSWAGGRGYEGRRPEELRARAAPPSLRLGMSREESLEVVAPGGAARSAVTLGGGHPAASPCVPAPRLQARAPSPASSELARTPGTAEAGRGARGGKRPSAPHLTQGSEATWGPGLAREWAGAWAQPASVAGQSWSLALPGLCDLGPVSSRLSLPPLRNGRLARPRGVLRQEVAVELRTPSQPHPRRGPGWHSPPQSPVKS